MATRNHAWTTAQLIRHYREQSELNQSELARRVGVTPQAVQHWEQKNTSPRPSLIPKIAQALGVEPRDLAHGAPLRETARPSGAYQAFLASSETQLADAAFHNKVSIASPSNTNATIDLGKFTRSIATAADVTIRRLPVNGGMERDVDLIAVSPDWVARRLPGRNPESLGLLGAYGNAMAPTLAEGSLVFVDTSKKTLDFDAVWVLKHRETHEIWIRRVQRRPDGSWALLYDNPKYDSLIVPAEQRTMFDVLGQVALRGTFEPL